MNSNFKIAWNAKLALATVIGLITAVLPVQAHHEKIKNLSQYTVYWKGLPPQSGSAQNMADPALATEIWKHAFVSTVQISNGQKAKAKK